jgi:hypothetical protein
MKASRPQLEQLKHAGGCIMHWDGVIWRPMEGGEIDHDCESPPMDETGGR